MKIKTISLSICLLFHSLCVIGMDHAEEVEKTQMTIFDLLSKIMYGTQKAVSLTIKHDELVLAASFAAFRYELWKREHAVTKETVTTTTYKPNADLPAGVGELLKEHYIKEERREEKFVPIHSKEFRKYARRFGQGQEAAAFIRFLGTFDTSSLHVGKPQEYDRHANLARYFEVAGATADAYQMIEYAEKQLQNTSKVPYMEHVPKGANYLLLRGGSGIIGAGIVTAKNNHMSCEEALVHRGIEIAARVGKEYISPESHTTVSNFFDSVTEAAQRQPYHTLVLRAGGYESKEHSTVSNALVTTGVSTVVRFAGKEIAPFLKETESGKEAKEWINQNVPEVVQEVGKELVVAGLTVGAVQMGKCFIPQYGASCIIL